MSGYQTLINKVAGLDVQHTVAIIACLFVIYEFIKQGFWTGLTNMSPESQISAMAVVIVSLAAIAAISGAYFSAKTPLLSVTGSPTPQTVTQTATQQSVTPQQKP